MTKTKMPRAWVASALAGAAIRGRLLGICLLFCVASLHLGAARLNAASSSPVGFAVAGSLALGSLAVGQGEHDSGAKAGTNHEEGAGVHDSATDKGTDKGTVLGTGEMGTQKGHPAELEHEGEDGHEMIGNPFLWLFHHVLPLDLEVELLGIFKFYNVNLWQIYVVILMVILFTYLKRGLLHNLKSGQKLNWLQRVFSGFVIFIRDEMVRPVLGDDAARKSTPYFLFLFFFIAFQNLAGLIPGGVTPTASIFVTAALALITFLIMLTGGMLAQGPGKFWINLVPHGLPLLLWPLMFVVELIGLIVKPFALMIRLFANMTGGHLVVLSFMGLIFYFGNKDMMGSLAYAVAVPSVGMSVFIMIIEGFVALLQAYIFTYLSILFIGMCLHPEH